MKIYPRKSDEINQITAGKHAILTRDVFEMENTIRTLMQSRSCYHNTLAWLEVEIAMNSIKNTLQTRETVKRMYSRWDLLSTRD